MWPSDAVLELLLVALAATYLGTLWWVHQVLARWLEHLEYKGGWRKH